MRTQVTMNNVKLVRATSVDWDTVRVQLYESPTDKVTALLTRELAEKLYAQLGTVLEEGEA